MDWSLVLNIWGPFVIVIAAWFFITRRMRGGPTSAMTKIERSLRLAEESVAEQRRTNALLEEIKGSFGKSRAD